MRKETISVLVMLSCTFFAACCANQQEYVAIEKALKSLSKVVVKYQTEFDRKVKFVELQEAIDAIDESMLDYQGTAKNKLDNLRTLNSAARLTYQNCVSPVFEWCVSINSTFDIFIPYIGDQSLTEHDRNIVWNMTVDALSDGHKKTNTSLELLKLVQKKTTDLKNLLDSMLHDLRYDFGPYGFYGKRKEELMNAIAESVKPRKALAIAAAISFFFGAISAIVLGPIGTSLVLLPIFVGLGLGAVIKGHRQATYEEELRVIQTFFNILDDRINKASNITGEINKDLVVDKINLDALAGLIRGAITNNKLLLVDSPNLRTQLVPSFRKLGKSCYDYTMWHGYGSEGYEHQRTRARRQATETCNARRLKAMTMITGSLPSNITFETLVSKAHSILKEINCESTILPTPPLNEQPALQLSNGKAEPTWIDETTEESLRLPSISSEKRASRYSSILSSKNMIVAVKHVQ